MSRFVFPAAAALIALVSVAAGPQSPQFRNPFAVSLAPCALVASSSGDVLYVAESLAHRIDVFDLAQRKVARSIALPSEPTGLALSPDGKRLFTTCSALRDSVCVLSVRGGSVLAKAPAGHGACAPVANPNGRELYVCNRFDNDVSVFDAATLKEMTRIPVLREPAAAAIAPDGQRLFVANLLPASRADAPNVAAAVTVIDTTTRQVVANINLASGSSSVRGICVSPDGQHVYATHVLARFQMPTTQVDRGWINTNALSVIDARALKRINTVLLDSVDKGAANPWGVACSPDGRFICVAHAGSHELSVIDAEALLDKLAQTPLMPDPRQANTDSGTYFSPLTAADVPNDLSFLVGLRRRIALPIKGPRALAVVGTQACAAGYFSDALGVADLDPQTKSRPAALPLGATAAMSPARKGEMNFNDAALCFQGWQSCASCHPDGRADGLNWDLLNDGLGNPKNAKSMLLAPQTPPAMSLGVRDDSAIAVRAGIRSVQFAVRPEEDAQAIDAYLKSLKPVPSPRLANGQLSEAAKRGEKLFSDGQVGCAVCHPPPLYTDLELHDVGTRGPFDQLDPTAKFDTPTLIEVWRTAPYLHDGRCASLEEALTTANPEDRHGRTTDLTKRQIADLVEYVRSL